MRTIKKSLPLLMVFMIVFVFLMGCGQLSAKNKEDELVYITENEWKERLGAMTNKITSITIENDTIYRYHDNEKEDMSGTTTVKYRKREGYYEMSEIEYDKINNNYFEAYYFENEGEYYSYSIKKSDGKTETKIENEKGDTVDGNLYWIQTHLKLLYDEKDNYFRYTFNESKKLFEKDDEENTMYMGFYSSGAIRVLYYVKPTGTGLYPNMERQNSWLFKEINKTSIKTPDGFEKAWSEYSKK